MLWLCIRFPRLPFDALSLNDAELIAVTINHQRTRPILIPSKAASQFNIKKGMEYATAAAVCGQLKAVERSSRAEQKALLRLAAWAYQWSSFITLRLADEKSLTACSMLWLEIAASFKLFGGREALLKSIEDELRASGHEYELGIAHTLEGAALLARSKRRVVASNTFILRRHIQGLPIALLDLQFKTLFELQRAGIREIGTFIDLPRAAIARRFGTEVVTYIDKILGIAPDPREAFQLPKHYRADCELGAEVFNTEALLFPVRRMLQELQGYLRAIDAGLQRFEFQFRHRDHTTSISIGSSLPERSGERLFALARERLERLTLDAPVLELTLKVDHFTAPAVQQTEIFSGDKSSTEQFHQVVDKLVARLGDDAIQTADLIADHRPEHAWCTHAISVTPANKTPAPNNMPPRPLWLMAEPKPIAAPELISTQPERIATGWWDGGDVQRDYYFARGPDGATMWVYRDLESGLWYLQGLCG